MTVSSGPHCSTGGPGRGCTGRVWYQGGYTGGYTGWVIRGHPARSQTARGANPDSGAGPGTSLQGRWSGWSGCSGRTGTVSAPELPGTTLRARSVPPGPLPVPGTSPRAKGRHFGTFPGNLVKTGKCHRKVIKRPLIVPIYKTGSRIHLLKFQDLRFAQPSLTRN